MELTDAVLRHAAEIDLSYGPPVLALRIESPLDRTEAAELARAAITTIADAVEVHWSVDDGPAGVTVRQWGHAPEIGSVLRALSRALDTRTPLLERDEERDRRHAWNMAHPYIRLPDEIVTKVHALPGTSHVGHWYVAFVLRDGRVVDDVELGFAGSIVTRRRKA